MIQMLKILFKFPAKTFLKFSVGDLVSNHSRDLNKGLFYDSDQEHV